MQYNLTTDQKKAIGQILCGSYDFSADGNETLRTLLIEQLETAINFANDDRWHTLTWFFAEVAAQAAKELARRAQQ